MKSIERLGTMANNNCALSLERIKMSGEDTTTYGQGWDIGTFGPGVPRDSVETVHHEKTFKGFR